jgi:hypothetical protein
MTPIIAETDAVDLPDRDLKLKIVATLEKDIDGTMLIFLTHHINLTMDFDGSVQSTKGHAEGTAVGYNKSKKGARSYYPLFCTVAQTGQFFDLHHRPGNVHDSNGAAEFMLKCFSNAKAVLKNTIFESRVDSAFFNQDVFSSFDQNHVKFSASVPFERFLQLKAMIEQRKRWHKIDTRWSYFETEWKPKSWASPFRFIFTRKKTKKQHKGPFDETWTKTNWKILLSPGNWGKFKNMVEKIDKIMGKGSLKTSLNCRLPPMPPIDFKV